MKIEIFIHFYYEKTKIFKKFLNEKRGQKKRIFFKLQFFTMSTTIRYIHRGPADDELRLLSLKKKTAPKRLRGGKSAFKKNPLLNKNIKKSLINQGF